MTPEAPASSRSITDLVVEKFYKQRINPVFIKKHSDEYHQLLTRAALVDSALIDAASQSADVPDTESGELFTHYDSIVPSMCIRDAEAPKDVGQGNTLFLEIVRQMWYNSFLNLKFDNILDLKSSVSAGNLVMDDSGEEPIPSERVDTFSALIPEYAVYGQRQLQAARSSDELEPL